MDEKATNIERMAKEAGIARGLVSHGSGGETVKRWDATPEQLAKFAALVAEDCAKAVEGQQNVDFERMPGIVSSAAVIRAKYCTPQLQSVSQMKKTPETRAKYPKP